MFKFTTRSRLKDIEKRMHSLENILLEMTDVIDMAQNFEGRIDLIEGFLDRKFTLPQV